MSEPRFEIHYTAKADGRRVVEKIAEPAELHARLIEIRRLELAQGTPATYDLRPEEEPAGTFLGGLKDLEDEGPEMTEIAKRVATAIALEIFRQTGVRQEWIDKQVSSLEGFELDQEGTIVDMIAIARAAIAAMREPTREMWAAMGNACYPLERHHDQITAAIWSAGIDEALK